MDASIIFSLLLGSKRTKSILDSSLVELYSPEYLSEELEEHKREILSNGYKMPSESEIKERADRISRIIGYE